MLVLQLALREPEPLADVVGLGQPLLGVVDRGLDLDQARLGRGTAGGEVGAEHVAVAGDRHDVRHLIDQGLGGGDRDPARCIDERDEMRQLVAEIARLPERQRMALVMREFDGRSHEETARLLHTTIPATKSLLIRAHSTLRRRGSPA